MYVHVRDQNDNATYASTGWVPTVSHFLACKDVASGSKQSGGRIVFLFFAWTHFLACEDVAGGSQQLGGRIIFLPVIWMHFLACEDVAGGSQLSGGKHFFHEIRWPVRWVPAVRWRSHYFVRNKEALAAAVDPAVSLSTYSTLPMEVIP